MNQTVSKVFDISSEQKLKQDVRPKIVAIEIYIFILQQTALLSGNNQNFVMQIQALSVVPEQSYVYYANWRVISGGYMSISISAVLISKAKNGVKFFLLEHSYSLAPLFSRIIDKTFIQLW